MVFTFLGGWMSDRIGRRMTFMIGYALLIVWLIPMWSLIDTGETGMFILAVVILGIALGPCYAPQPALYAEMFPARVRYSGTSIGYAIGSVIGGAFAPLIAQLLLDSTGQSWTIGLYLAIVCVISFLAAWAVPKSVEKGDLRVLSLIHI